MGVSTESILQESERRLSKLIGDYDPLSGVGSFIPRFKFRVFNDPYSGDLFLPETMREKWGAYSNTLEGSVSKRDFKAAVTQLIADRVTHDFEYWANSTVFIKDKKTGDTVNFTLNLAQRMAIVPAEEMRVNRIPIRMKCLKGRQVGFSTLWLVYESWIQLVLRTGWSSTIVADVEGQSKNIRGTYTRMLERYPLGTYSLEPYEKDTKNRIIKNRDCIVCVGSFQKPEGLRSFDLKIGHFSELSSWKTTISKSPEELVLAVSSAIPMLPDTFIVMESTPKGFGYFHDEYMSAKKGEDNIYKPIYSPWFDNPVNISQFLNDDARRKFAENMSERDKAYWQLGASLEGLLWWNQMFIQVGRDEGFMMQEFSGTEEEAFVSSGHPAISFDYLKNLELDICEPEIIGDMMPYQAARDQAFIDLHIKETPTGLMKIWNKPNVPEVPDGYTFRNSRYVVAVDIGGMSKTSDFSTITVIDRYYIPQEGHPEIAAEWKGHIDPDLLAWLAAQVAMFYEEATLVFESNTYETKHSAATEGDHRLTILDTIKHYYKNLYKRQVLDQRTKEITEKIGFHTNSQTKDAIVSFYRSLARMDKGQITYVEKSREALNEFYTLITHDDGTIGASPKNHDDLAMGRMIGLWVACSPDSSVPQLKMIKKKTEDVNPRPRSGSLAHY